MCLSVAKRQDIAGVTERRKRLESLRRMSAEWQFLITLNEQLRSLKDPVAIQEAAVRSIGEHLHASRVNYAHIDGDEFVVSRSYADEAPPLAGRGPVARFGASLVAACRRGETVAVDDVNTDPRFTDAERAQLLAGGMAAFVGAPLIKDGRWLAVLGVHADTPRTWTRDQIALVEVTAERTWGAGERARAELALDQSQRRLFTFANLLPRALAARLHKWVGEGRYASLFDNIEDTLTVERLQVFDLEAMRAYPVLLEPLLFYVLHRVVDPRLRVGR